MDPEAKCKTRSSVTRHHNSWLHRFACERWPWALLVAQSALRPRAASAREFSALLEVGVPEEAVWAWSRKSGGGCGPSSCPGLLLTHPHLSPRCKGAVLVMPTGTQDMEWPFLTFIFFPSGDQYLCVGHRLWSYYII